jgi:hypothetical protein
MCGCELSVRQTSLPASYDELAKHCVIVERSTYPLYPLKKKSKKETG